ncbi:MAG: rhomboid family intramembrane serine protease [Hyphomonadaceae bacterium]|nr:rhomboid family intramembrane serine protease [Hyphomonadaceae bacterium]
MNMQVLMAAHAALGLLATNIILSIVAFGNMRLLDAMMFDIGRIKRNHEYHRTITSGFIHGDPAHLFMNMLSLFFIGPAIEGALGTWVFLAFYMACLLGGSAWTLMEHWRDSNYRALGASGAVSGVTAAFGLFAPFQMIIVFVIPMPAILFAVLFIAYSAFASGRIRDGIGHAAHLGGALTGVALVCIFWPGAVRSLWDQVLARLPF